MENLKVAKEWNSRNEKPKASVGKGDPCPVMCSWQGSGLATLCAGPLGRRRPPGLGLTGAAGACRSCFYFPVPDLSQAVGFVFFLPRFSPCLLLAAVQPIFGFLYNRVHAESLRPRLFYSLSMRSLISTKSDMVV